MSGERGTGRTTLLAELTEGVHPVWFDGLDLLRLTEMEWIRAVAVALDSGLRPVVVDNVHLLSPLAAHGLYESTSRSAGWFALASAPLGTVSPDVYRLIDSCRTRVELIPLRLRKHEITTLIDAMLEGMGARIRFTAGAMRLLLAHDWPGNVAELEAEVLAASRTRSVGDVSVGDLGRLRERAAMPLLSAIDSAQRTVIEDKLIAHRGNKLAAARHLGISRTTLYKRMRRFGIAG
ncbi:hypothetical protein BH92_17685 [Rhodococcoides fascians A21d2]|uniref:helix-turn-helix domain-containing protein n=1 Tax=Nocardiaceae TaxID=85025 RepID=UPI0011400AFB|nr:MULTISPECIES: helix-turn-helix domain-containing protein [Rhodococcus]QII01458.1 hypothetical protein BH92_17685 [Rhodococcus fascians A21d2]